MKLTAEQIKKNWDIFEKYINDYITGERKEKLINFYRKYQDRIILMPASYKKEYHNAFPGGYIDHVNRVVESCLRVNEVWIEMGVDTSTYTTEELVFSAINHDLGKIGDEKYESYIPQDDQWRRDKLGEEYKFNDRLPFASVPDRGLFLLQSHGIIYTFNEMVAIQTHDGLYDDANKKYFLGWNPGQKPRTSLPFIIHQGDLMAARIEFEREWLYQFKDELVNDKSKPKKEKTKTKALKSVGSSGLKNILDTI